jgi:hypothetical protein
MNINAQNKRDRCEFRPGYYGWSATFVIWFSLRLAAGFVQSGSFQAGARENMEDESIYSTRLPWMQAAVAGLPW